MCNASNHSASCRCGWGGDGHAGASSGWHGRHGSRERRESILYAGESYRIDGALKFDYDHEGFCRPSRCPRCGDDVFFIRYNGGSAWFDDLGSPWPKHPCFADEIRRGNAPAVDLAASIRTAVGNHTDARLGVVTHADMTTTVEGRRYHVLCTDGRARGVTIESTINPAFLVARFAVVLRQTYALVLLNPMQRYRFSDIRLEVPPARPVS